MLQMVFLATPVSDPRFASGIETNLYEGAVGRTSLTPQPHGLLQCGNRYRFQPGKGMTRSYDNHIPFLEQPPVIKTLGKVVRYAKKRRMNAACEESIHQSFTVVLDKMHLKPLDTAGKLGQRLDHEKGRDGWWQADVYGCHLFSSESLRLLSCTVGCIDGALQHWQHKLSEIRQLSQSAFAMNQVTSQFVLQFSQSLCERWLGDVALLGRASEIEGLGQREEVAYMLKLHVLHLWLMRPWCPVTIRT